jgi:hypothetical protein
MYLHTLPKPLSMRVFKPPPNISLPRVEVEGTKALNKWDLSFQRVTPTTVSFIEVAIKGFILAIRRLSLDASK